MEKTRELRTATPSVDIYENENQLGADKKSMAIQLHFESTEKSLNSEEIDKLINRLISQYEQQLSAVIRR